MLPDLWSLMKWDMDILQKHDRSQQVVVPAALRTAHPDDKKACNEQPELRQGELAERRMAISHQFPFAVGMVLLYIIVGHALERYRQAGRGGHCCAHESVPAVLLGMLVGAVLRWGLDERVPFSADVFFFFVLPPIIFAQGYMLRGRNFFDNFYHIFAFGIMGTLLQFVILTSIASGCSGLVSAFGQGGRIQFNVLECLVLAAVLSPSDEVAVLSLVKPETFPQLGAILFGEGVLNDALSIVLFRAVFNMLGKAGDAADPNGTAWRPRAVEDQPHGRVRVVLQACRGHPRGRAVRAAGSPARPQESSRRALRRCRSGRARRCRP